MVFAIRNLLAMQSVTAIKTNANTMPPATIQLRQSQPFVNLYSAMAKQMVPNGSSKNSVEDASTEYTETPSAARNAADEERALRRKPSLIHGTMKDGRNCCG